MTKTERLQEELKRERAAQRHREYAERMRLERGARASAGQRLEQRRDQQRAELARQRFSERQQWRQETEAARQAAEALRAQRADRRPAEQKAAEEERQRPRKRRQELANKELEGGRRLDERHGRVVGSQAQRLEPPGMDRKPLDAVPGGLIAPSRSQEVRRPAALRVLEAARAHIETRRRQQAERRSANRQALNEERLGRIELRQRLGAQRAREYRQKRAEEETSREQPTASSGRQAAGRSEERRPLGEAPDGARGRAKTLQQQQSERRSEDRKALYEQRAGRAAVRQKLAEQRVEEHRQLRAATEASKRKAATLRAREAARRTEERTPAAALAALPTRPEARAQAGAPSPAPPEQPFEGLQWLRIADSFVVNENGNAVALRGITVQGLDSVTPASDQSLAESLALDDANLSALTGLWGINLVRLPFLTQTMLSGNGSLSANDLLAGLDDAVSALSGSGVYTLLSLQAPPSQGATTALPDQQAFDCWSLLAQHYEEESAVLFEIYSSALPVASGWLEAAPVLIGSIRRQHPASLLFVGNGGGGADTSGLPLLFSTGDPTPNIVYTLRVAPQHQFSADEGNLLAVLTRSFPVFASDWSDSGTSDFDRSAELAANVFSRYGIGWAASNWNAEPRLVTDARAHNFASTRWGLAVQRAMTLPTKEPLMPLLPGETDGG